MKSFLISIGFLFITFTSFAQTDTEFWFGAPILSAFDGTTPLDEPIWVKLSAQSQSANVQICIDLIAGRCTTATVPANSAVSVNLTAWKNDLQNVASTGTTSQNKALHITSDQKITASYEVSRWSTEIFVLKGKNGLGLNFYIPMQTKYDNRDAYTPNKPVNGFIIVATEDNTQVTITPTKALSGHPANTPFTVSMMKGQTYFCQANTRLAADHPAGSHVTSDKPIAITSFDDNVAVGPCADMAGDQILPVEFAGTSFIFNRNTLTELPASTDPYAQRDNASDYFYIMGLTNNTNIEIHAYDKTTGPIVIKQKLQAGQQFQYQYPGFGPGNPPSAIPSVAYMTSDQPVQVFQLTGRGCEASASVIPPVGCTGSTKLAFSISNLGGPNPMDGNKVANGYLGILLVTKSSNQDGFTVTINGKDRTPASSGFTVVNGFATKYIEFLDLATDPGIPNQTTGPCLITNSKGLFHASFLCSTVGTIGASYGYFSDYKVGSSQIHNMSIFNSCRPLLKTDDGATSYEWQNSSGQRIGGDSSSYKTQGEKFVRVIVDSKYCPKTDTFNLSYSPIPPSHTLNICKDTVTFDASSPIAKSYKWNDGTTLAKKTVAIVGAFTVTIQDGYCEEIVTYNTVSNCGLTFKVPNVFTPNGDGVNDVFKLDSISGDVNQFSIIIYNRWGRKVYESKDIYFNWDGNKMADGTYYWVIEATGKNGDKLKPNGIVTIVR